MEGPCFVGILPASVLYVTVIDSKDYLGNSSYFAAHKNRFGG
jgi:hypothetical protein